MTREHRNRRLQRDGGFTLIEFMIAMGITVAVLGGTVALATQLQKSYTTQLDDAAVEQEVRFAIDWIARILRSAGSNPYSIQVSDCPAGGRVFTAVEIDPDADGVDDDIRVNADIGTQNGFLGGLIGVCDESGEDITIAHDAAASVITYRDMNTDVAALAMTDPIITVLRFTYLNSVRAVTTDPDLIAYVQVRVTGQSQVRERTGDPITSTLETEVRLRTR